MAPEASKRCLRDDSRWAIRGRTHSTHTPTWPVMRSYRYLLSVVFNVSRRF